MDLALTSDNKRLVDLISLSFFMEEAQVRSLKFDVEIKSLTKEFFLLNGNLLSNLEYIYRKWSDSNEEFTYSEENFVVFKNLPEDRDFK